MAKNFIQPGEVVTVTAPAGGVASGDVIVVGNLAGVCTTSAATGAEVELAVVGVFELPKATGAAINAGQSVWWSTTDKNVKNASAAGLWPIGVAVRAAGTTDTSVRVRLNGVAVAAA
jgi:predicted RecA/RadA family phage recombinase